MIERRHGYIVNTGSVAGLLALTGEGAPADRPVDPHDPDPS